MTETSSPEPKHITVYQHNSPRLLSRLKVFLIILLLSTLPIVLIINHFYPQSGLVTPLASSTNNLFHFFPNQSKPSKIVYGFIPYWNFKYVHDIPFSHLTHLAVFGIAFNPDGTIQTKEADYQEPGWRAFQLSNFSELSRLAKSSNTKLILTLRGFDNDTIDSIIDSDTTTQTFINNALSFLEEKNFDGLNLDFEYLGEPEPVTISRFTAFVGKLSRALKAKDPSFQLSLDVFADSSQNQRIWDLSALHPLVDHIIIMAYDFHRPSSSIAGPVAPLYGANELWSHDITSLLASHLKKIPNQKLLLGVPFYGYQWRTTTTNHLSQTFPKTGELATINTVNLLIQDIQPTVNWDPLALSPWLFYQEDNDVYQIYYENEKSLALKFDLVNQTDLSGIAIWALGYEGADSKIWSVITDKFK